MLHTRTKTGFILGDIAHLSSCIQTAKNLAVKTEHSTLSMPKAHHRTRSLSHLHSPRTLTTFFTKTLISVSLASPFRSSKSRYIKDNERFE